MIEQGFRESEPIARIKQLPLYRKALDLYALSRKLVESSSTRSLQLLYQSSSEQERLMEDLVILTLKLPFEIALAQTSNNYNTKMLSSKKVHKRIVILKKHCKRLKENSITNQENVSLLYKELLTFKKMHKQWNLLLTQQN